MRTFDQMHKDCGSCVYWGERGSWYVVAGRSRDSDSLEESNFQVLLSRLGGESDTVAVERESHWAVGWVEHMLVHPHHRAGLRIAVKAHKDMEAYPVLDENHWSNLEYDRFWEWARGELQSFDGGWETVLSDLMYEGNYEIGCDSSEWRAIEAARVKLEEMQPFYDCHACSSIDPRQIPLF